MDPDTVKESNLSPKSRSFLNRVDDDIGPIFKRCNARHRQTFYNLVNVFVFNIGSICIHGKQLLRKFTFHQKYRERSHTETNVQVRCTQTTECWVFTMYSTSWDAIFVATHIFPSKFVFSHLFVFAPASSVGVLCGPRNEFQISWLFGHA